MSTKNDSFAAEVAQHYNQVEQKPVRERSKSEIIVLRRFNNAFKTSMHKVAFKLADRFIKSGEKLRILELGCGKGGDLSKYSNYTGVGLVVGVDIADVSIQQAKERYEDIRRGGKCRMDGKFFVADLTRVDISSKLLELGIEDKFHLASSQFSIHYSFESYEQAIMYIKNAADHVERTGYFIGTYPDGPKLLKMARESETPGLYEHGDIMSVKFSKDDLDNPQPFGTKYHFYLKEVVDCPEFLVHPEVLKEVMLQLGFKQVFDRSFEEHLRRYERSFVEVSEQDKKVFFEAFKLHKGLEFGDNEAQLDYDMWQAASIYRCFCYVKMV